MKEGFSIFRKGHDVNLYEIMLILIDYYRYDILESNPAEGDIL